VLRTALYFYKTLLLMTLLYANTCSYYVKPRHLFYEYWLLLEWIAIVVDLLDEWCLVLLVCGMSPLCVIHSFAWPNGQTICSIVLPTFLFPFQLCFFVPFNTPTFFIFVVDKCFWYYYQHLLFYAGVMFLKYIAHIEHKIPI
jgi:hypothetical protein